MTDTWPQRLDNAARAAREVYIENRDVGPGDPDLPPWEELPGFARRLWVDVARAVMREWAGFPSLADSVALTPEQAERLRQDYCVRPSMPTGPAVEKLCVCGHAERHHAAFHDSVPDCSQCWCTGWRDA